MQSILLVSQSIDKAKEFIGKISRREKVEAIDIGIYYFEKTVGIDEVRDIRKKIFLKPLRSKTKIAFIQAYEGITIESQNALLKILEEPPNNTTIIIAVRGIGLILPTILSRCKIIDLQDKSLELPKKESAQYFNIIISLSSSGVGDRLKLAQDIVKNKEEVIQELEKIIMVARQALINSVCHSEGTKRLKNLGSRSSLRLSESKTFANAQDDNWTVSQYLNILISLNKTHTILKTTNVNPRLTLENFFLNM